MARRTEFNLICAASGARVLDAADGWPGRASIALPDGSRCDLFIYAAPVTTHSRQISGEVRLQPPGQRRPIVHRPSEVSLLLGLADNGVVVGASVERRTGRDERWTVTFRESLLDEAAIRGWAVADRPLQPYGAERIHAFFARLLPAYVEMVRHSIEIDLSALETTIAASGFDPAAPDQAGLDRMRQATNRLVRDAVFGRMVCTAYNQECALCGLDLGLVVGAHVLPVAAPGSPDTIHNGVCLCENHHRAFDRHLIYVDPANSAVAIHPRVHTNARTNQAARAFLVSTAAALRTPQRAADRVAGTMLRRRYEYFSGLYHWV